MIDDESLNKYINEALSEVLIRSREEEILYIMKTRQEKYPSERNNIEWLEFSDYICKRRYHSQKN